MEVLENKMSLEAEFGFNYLKNRGVEEKEITEFEMGYCDSNLLIHSHNFPDKYSEFVTEKFRDSILIPFYSLYNDYVGILSRRIVTTQRSKCDSTSFDKTEHLFGLNKTWKHLLEKDFVYIVEGPFDLIACWKYDYKNVVALLGTSLSFAQTCLLKRFVKKAYFVLDNDKAGITAMYRYGEQLKDFGIESYSFRLEKDPDEILRNNPNALKVF
jgi:DNA primase